MRIMMIAAAAMFAVAPPAFAQSGAPAPEAQQPQTQQAPAITKVEVVDLAELPPEVQTQVTTAAEQSTEADLENMRASIDAHEMAAAALASAGVTSDIVIAAAMSPDGTLTLITRGG